MYLYRGITMIALVWIGIWSSVYAHVTEESKERLLTLRNLSLEELQKVKISLDDVFDVFDGLVRTQKVKLATGLRQNTTVAPSVTTVITAQDIEATGAHSMEEVLRMVPGMSISHAGNYTPIYTLRGMFSLLNAEVLFLLDGTPIDSMLTGNRGIWGDVVPPLEQIARIEIIRGPASALYGANAYAGVINMITKTAQNMNGTEVGGYRGSYNSYAKWVTHGQNYGPLEIATHIYSQHSDGDAPWIPRDAQTSLDASSGAQKIPGYRPASLAPGPAHLHEEKLHAYLDLRYQAWQIKLYYQEVYDHGTGVHFLIVDPWGSGDTERYGLDLKWSSSQLMVHWDLDAYFTYQQLIDKADFRRNPPEAFVPTSMNGAGGVYHEGVREQYEYQTSRWLMGFNSLYSGFNQHKLRMGIGYVLSDLNPSIWVNRGRDATGTVLPLNSPMVDLSDSHYANYPHVDRTNWQAFIQDSWGFASGWELTSGLRYDSYLERDRSWQTINPRLVLVWQTTSCLTSKLLYGRAFRAPTFRELYLPVGGIVGNPLLEPETISTYELALDYQAMKNLNFSLNLFTYRANDQIVTVPLNERMNTYRNVAAWKGKGFEIEGRWKMTTNSSLLFNYAYANNNETSAHGEVRELGNYPHHVFYSRFDWMPIEGWFLNLQAKRVMDRERAASVSRLPVKDSTTLDLTLRYKDILNKHWNLALGIRNLLDAEIVEPSPPHPLYSYDFIMPGRNWFAEIRYHF